MTNLFQRGPFTLHSGATTNWKIECDALTDDDLLTVASWICGGGERKFCGVYGIPRGGERIEKALACHDSVLAEWIKQFPNPHLCTPEMPFLIVDDVYTTGGSMEHARAKFSGLYKHIVGFVLFARSPTPDWITPIFRFNLHSFAES